MAPKSGRAKFATDEISSLADADLPDAAQAAAPDLALDLEQPTPAYPRYRVEPGEAANLAGRDPDEHEDFTKQGVKKELKRQQERMIELQERLYAERQQALLIVLQATDTGGKDGTIEHVFQGVNPQGCQVWSFKAPTAEELAHDFLWRIHRGAPARGMISIFNRSHYEDVIITRVKNLVPEATWRARYDLINDWERLLVLEGTTILKFFLHISKDEQRERLQSRLDDPAKHWKFNIDDLKERERWDEYQVAIEEALTRCSTAYAPWYVVPANRKWYRNLVIARAIADTLAAMNPQFPPAPEGLDQVVIPE